MGIKLSRLIFILCIAWVFYWNVNKMVIGYAVFMWAAMEIFNSNKVYKNLRYYKLYNALFIGLLLFTTIDRSRKSVIPAAWEYTLDVSVHFFFASITILLICIMAIVFLKEKPIKSSQLIIVAVVLFNIIGLINEFYQNIFKPKHVDIWLIDNESKLDITVNLISSIICILLHKRFPKYFPTAKTKQVASSFHHDTYQ
jgi:hypothetical protein